MKGRELDKIDKYILGEMSSEDVQLFEQQLLADIELKTSIEIRKAIHQEINEGYKKELKEKLVAYDKQLDKASWLSKSMKLAAGTVLVLIGVFVIYQFTNKPADLSAYDFYEEGINNTMNDDTDKVKFNNAMSQFRMEKYASAIIAFEHLKQEKPLNDTLNYYLGVSYFRTNKYPKSIGAMKNVLLTEQSIYNEKAKFRLGLAYYANNNQEAAKPLFEEIRNDETNPFSSDAKTILDFRQP